MVNDRVNRWLTLFANLAVVAGIMFLAFELHQNNKFLEAQGRASVTTHRISMNDRFMVPETAALIVKASKHEELTDDEDFRLERLVRINFISWESDYREHKEGMLKTLPLAAFVDAFVTIPRMLETWERDKHIFEAEFVQYIETQVLPQL